MNGDKLKGKIREKRKTYASCAKVLGISTTSFSNKTNEVGGSRFTVVEAQKLGNYLEMSGTEKVDIFLE